MQSSVARLRARTAPMSEGARALQGRAQMSPRDVPALPRGGKGAAGVEDLGAERGSSTNRARGARTVGPEVRRDHDGSGPVRVHRRGERADRRPAAEDAATLVPGDAAGRPTPRARWSAGRPARRRGATVRRRSARVRGVRAPPASRGPPRWSGARPRGRAPRTATGNRSAAARGTARRRRSRRGCWHRWPGPARRALAWGRSSRTRPGCAGWRLLGSAWRAEWSLLHLERRSRSILLSRRGSGKGCEGCAILHRFER